MGAMQLEHGRFRADRGQFYGTPKEVWGFRRVRTTTGRSAVDRASGFLKANADLFGLDRVIERLHARAVMRSPGATHVILQQHYHRAKVHRGFVTVHMDRDHRVYLVKNRAVPWAMLGGENLFTMSAERAKRFARSYLGVTSRNSETRRTVDRRWYPLGPLLRATYRVRVRLEKPRQDWIVYVDANDGTIIEGRDNLSLATGRGKIFNPNPVVALGGYRKLLDAAGKPVDVYDRRAYEDVNLLDMDNTGYLDGRRVYSLTTPPRYMANRNFVFTSNQKGFEETMAYYHLDRAVAYVEGLGYRGRYAIFKEPLQFNARASDKDDAWYDPSDRTLGFGTGGVDCAEDAETIVHEFGHALQDMICPDFGQSEEAAAMGEGFGDYLAASFFHDKKKSARLAPYRAAVMSWDGIKYAQNKGRLKKKPPPSVRRVDRRWTYDDFIAGDIPHANGEIWSATLWDIRRKLGRRAADRIVIESHFQQDAFTNFVRGARAIIDADRNLCRGRHVKALKRVFKKRRIGPVEEA